MDSANMLSFSISNSTHTAFQAIGFTLFWHKKVQSDSNSFILTQLDDGSHLWTHAMLDSDTAMLDSDTLLSFLRFTQKTLSLHSDSDST